MTNRIKFQSRKVNNTAYADERELDYFGYEFLKSYIYGLFSETIADPRLVVVRMLGGDSEMSQKLTLPSLHDVGDTGGVLVQNNLVSTSLLYDDKAYELVVTKQREPFGNEVHFFAAALGLEEGADKPSKLLDTLVSESLRHSFYNNRFLKVKPAEERSHPRINVASVSIEETRLSDVFLPRHIKDSLGLFLDCILRYPEIKQPMRYLLSGKPGTAKTKIIRAIAAEAKGKATFIFTDGSDNRIDAVFSFAECFSPAVVCIDDVDLIVGDRERESHRAILGKFLNCMDGFLRSDVFVLATTNNKMLVDMAASRPGRFDRILDMEPIEAQYYLDLVRSKTKSEIVIALFDESVSDELESRGVSGAFIATLVKHCELLEKVGNRKVSSDDLIQIVAEMDKEFHKAVPRNGNKTGFIITGKKEELL